MFLRQCRFVAFIGALMLMRHGATVAEFDNNSPLGVLAHPAGFGQPWSEDVTAQIVILTLDLCQNSSSNNMLSNSTGNVALFHDPYEKDHSRCSFSEMTKSADAFYPTIQYLLIQDEQGKCIRAMAKDPEVSDSKLKLAMLSFEDGELVKDLAKNYSEAAVDGGILVQIDATSRSIFDDCDCRNSEELSTTLLVLRLMSIFSILGSIYILFSLFGTTNRRSRNIKSTFNRLLMAISVCDILSSSAFSFGSALMPASPPGDFEGYLSQTLWDAQFPGAIGTPATCTAQGFFIHFGLLGSGLFTAFVGIQTLLLVRYNWKEQQMQKAEIVFFLVAILIPLTTGIWASVIDLMNPLLAGFCWIDVSPQICESIDVYPLLKDYCDDVVRGEDYVVYAAFFGGLWVLLSILAICGTMISLFLFVRNKERRAARWGVVSAREGRQQKMVLAKALLYISANLLVWVPSIVAIVTRIGSEGDQVFEVNSLIPSIFLPLQGFLNAMIHSGAVDKCVQRLFCFSVKEETRSYFESSRNLSSSRLGRDAFETTEISC